MDRNELVALHSALEAVLSWPPAVRDQVARWLESEIVKALRLDLTPSTPSSRGFDRCQARIAQARTGHLRESRVAPIPTVGQRQLGSRVTGLEEEKGQAKRSMRPELSRPPGPSPLTCFQSCGATEREPARHLIPKPRWGQSFYTPRSRNVAPHLELPS